MLNLSDVIWDKSIYEYVETGDVRPLAANIREKEIPEKYRTKIADILEGKLTHKKLSSEAARSFRMKQEYISLVGKVKSLRSIERSLLPANKYLDASSRDKCKVKIYKSLDRKSDSK